MAHVGSNVYTNHMVHVFSDFYSTHMAHVGSDVYTNHMVHVFSDVFTTHMPHVGTDVYTTHMAHVGSYVYTTHMAHVGVIYPYNSWLSCWLRRLNDLHDTYGPDRPYGSCWLLCLATHMALIDHMIRVNKDVYTTHMTHMALIRRPYGSRLFRCIHDSHDSREPLEPNGSCQLRHLHDSND
jgi:hypothetical protein